MVDIIGDVLREPMFALLLGAGAVYLVLDDLGEAAMLLAFATFSVLITVVQQTRSERVLDALRDIASPRAMVIRGGARTRNAALLALTMQVDESLLRGESVCMRKVPAAHAIAMARPGGENTPFVYFGTLVV